MRVPLPVPKRRARIEIIPLIDIVFFLLATFVMVSMSMIKNQGIMVKLPAAQTSSPQDINKIVTVSIKDDGSIYIDKDRVSAEALTRRLKALKAADPNVGVLINGDERSSFGSAVQILDDVRSLGIVKVSIMTKGSKKAGE